MIFQVMFRDILRMYLFPRIDVVTNTAKMANECVHCYILGVQSGIVGGPK